MASARTRRKPRYGGSILSENITELEQAEYRQNGSIRIKETPAEGLSYRQWEWGYHRSINFAEVLGAREVYRTSDDFDPPASGKLLNTWHGIIAVENLPTCYIITCINYNQKKSIVRELELYGYRTTSYRAKTLVVYKRKKEFVAYQREDR